MSGKKQEKLDRKGIIEFGIEMPEEHEDVIIPKDISEVGDLEKLGEEITEKRKKAGKQGVVFVAKPGDYEDGDGERLSIFCLFESEIY